MVQQRNLFPIEIVVEAPHTGGTKDLKRVGWDSANVMYAIKSEQDGALIPIVEWIGFQLSRLCSVLTPDCDIIRCINGELALGIRWVDNATEMSDPKLSLAQRMVLLKENSKQISATLALDDFLSNIDRNCTNFLFIERGGVPLCYSIDYSRAGPRMYSPPQPPFGTWPMPSDCPTQQIKPLLEGGKPDQKMTAQVNEALKAISSATFQDILDAAPDEWFTLVSRQELMTWWDTDTAQRV